MGCGWGDVQTRNNAFHFALDDPPIREALESTKWRLKERNIFEIDREG